MTPAQLPVLLVDDDPDMLARLGEVLGSVGIAPEQLCEAGSLAQCQQLVAAPGGALQPLAMALVDLGLPDGSGIDLIGWLRARSPALPILVVSAWSTEEMILGALRAGANGYVLKERDDLEIALSVRNVLKGGAPIDPFIARRILDLVGRPAGRPPTPSQPPDPALRDALTEREREILDHVAAGLSNREIAESLHLSRWTIDTHIRHIYDKLAVSSRTQALRRAREHGLLR
ncbi:DNA-binding NarL/FixJ family response regulator [Comamonas sp. BIGb0152]|uniref:response regulator transcription factor n=1 Tax=Comamonas sp. BIGb0152 TaxID=2940601 RepID=UPI0021686F52|nr:response regulator transcription factor [Comamonas sp. BIGb0152]MCS4296001.1 DNA-binding NarL/FixJ family response regulator [Comamonas sp. BIGb0152]